MFQTFQDLYTECQSLSSDDNSDTLTLFKKWLNQGAGKCYRVIPHEWFMGTATDLTVDGTYSYPKPYNCKKVHTVKVDDSSNEYTITEYPGDEALWDSMVGISSGSESNIPTYFFVKKNTIEFYPTSSTSAYTITYKYKKSVKDMTADNHTTESIKTATAGSTAIVGNTGVLWTSAMIGRFLKITGDEMWYEITAVPTATTLTLAREYTGESIVAGTTAYIIGEMSLLTEDFQDLPIEYAMWKYYRQKKDLKSANDYKLSWTEGLQELKGDSNQTTSGLIGGEVEIVDPNLNPELY